MNVYDLHMRLKPIGKHRNSGDTVYNYLELIFIISLILGTLVSPIYFIRSNRPKDGSRDVETPISSSLCANPQDRSVVRGGLYGISGGMQGLTPNLDENTDKFITPPQPAQGSGVVIYDHVVLFTPDRPVFRANLSLTEGRIYRFQFETYTPYDPSFTLDLGLTAPSGVFFHLTDYTSEILRDKIIVYLHYGAAETGLYEFSFDSHTASNINVHIFINETGTVSEYFQQSPEWAGNGFRPEILDFYNIHTYSTYSRSVEYEIPMQRDIEYWFNFFRVNPLVGADCEQIGYVDPYIWMNLTLEDALFTYWPEGEVQVGHYALDTNLAVRDSMVNEKITLRFGAHADGIARVRIFMNYTKTLPLNFAFLCFAADNITYPANNTAIGADGGIDSNSTSETPNNDQNSLNATNQNNSSNTGLNSTSPGISGVLDRINDYINRHFYSIFSIVLGIIISAYAWQYISPKFKFKRKIPKLMREGGD